MANGENTQATAGPYDPEFYGHERQPDRPELTYVPLGADGKFESAPIPFPAAQSVTVNFVSAVALDPAKFYIIEADATHVTKGQMEAIAQAVTAAGIKVAILCTMGGHALRIVGAEAPRG